MDTAGVPRPYGQASQAGVIPGGTQCITVAGWAIPLSVPISHKYLAGKRMTKFTRGHLLTIPGQLSAGGLATWVAGVTGDGETQDIPVGEALDSVGIMDWVGAIHCCDRGSQEREIKPVSDGGLDTWVDGEGGVGVTRVIPVGVGVGGDMGMGGDMGKGGDTN